VLAQVVQREIGEHGLGCDSFLLGARGDSRKFVARARFVGAREQFLDRAEAVGRAEQSRREFHWRSASVTRADSKWKEKGRPRRENAYRCARIPAGSSRPPGAVARAARHPRSIRNPWVIF